MGHKDPVTAELRQDLQRRDRGCVGVSVGMPEACGSQFGSGSQIILEVDHVNSAGFGKRGPSTMGNCVLLCGWHHRMKTESSKKWRLLLNEYLADKENADGSVSGSNSAG
jgi:hypothetical protein